MKIFLSIVSFWLASVIPVFGQVIKTEFLDNHLKECPESQAWFKKMKIENEELNTYQEVTLRLPEKDTLTCYSFVNDQRKTKQGRWIGYGECGHEKGWYEQNIKTGEWRCFESPSRLIERATYKDGKLHGLFESYFPDGTVKEVGRYVDGEKQGEWTTYSAFGKVLKESKFDQGQPIGLWKEFYDNGQLRIIKEYDATGSGVEKQFYENGKKKAEGTYVDYQLDGPWREYDNHEELTVEGSYAAGKQDGYWKVYILGELVREASFDHGKLEKEWQCTCGYNPPLFKPGHDPNNAELIMENSTIDSVKVYKIVEVMPEFPEGEAGLYSFINDNVVFPKIARDAGISGKVYVRFEVTECGLIRNIELARGAYPSLDDEALRVVSMMPAWVPGRARGKRVNVEYVLPINFVLR